MATLTQAEKDKIRQQYLQRESAKVAEPSMKMTAATALDKNVNPYSGTTLSAKQKQVLQAQEDVLSGKTTASEAAANREKAMGDALKKSTTINNYNYQDTSNLKAQTALNQKYGLAETTGLVGTPVNPKTGQIMNPDEARDFTRELNMAKKIGINLSTITPDQEKLLFKATYSPDELQKLGLAETVNPPPVMTAGGVNGGTAGGSPGVAGTTGSAGAPSMPLPFDPAKLKALGLSDEQIAGLQTIGGAANDAAANLGATPKPTQSAMAVLQEALNKKNNVTNQNLGKSQLFEKAGLSGYESLAQSLNMRSQEMTDRYNSFKTTVADTATGMTDVYNSALEGYKTFMDQYNTDVERMMKMNEAAKEQERALELLQRRAEIDQESYLWQKEVDAKYAPKESNFQFISETENQQAGYFNKDTGEFIPLSVGGDAYNGGGSSYLGDGVVGNNAGYTYGDPVPHGSANTMVVASNPSLINIYKNGFQKAAGANGYGGQCAYEAEQWTTLGGKNWAVGNSIQQKAASLDKYVKQGLGFYKGQGVPQVGNAVISNDDPNYGHVWVINSITADGKLVASEFNRAGTRTFSNNRIVDPNDKSILGFLKTEPKSQYQVKAENTAAKNIQSAAKGIEQIAKGKVQGGLLDLLRAGTGAVKDAAINKGKSVIQDQEVAKVNAQIQAGIESGILDENGTPYSPDRMAIRSGTLPDGIISQKYKDLQSAVKKGYEPPEALSYFQQDLVYGAQKKKELEKLSAPLTDSQSKNLGFAVSAQQAEGFMPKNGNDASLANLNNWFSRAGKNDDIVSDKINEIKDPTARQMVQAEMQWIANVLRGESGAAISLGEYKTAGATYFPRPGDSAEDLARKKIAREQKVQNLLVGSGAAGAQLWQNEGYDLPPSIAKLYGISAPIKQDPLGIAGGGLSNPLNLSL